MKVTRAIRMEFEPKDKPFDAYEAAMEAGSPSLAHVAMKACEAARETGLRKGFVEVSEKEASVRLPNPVPRRHSFSRELPLPFDDARCAEFCADMLAWARSMRAEAAEKEAGGSAVEELKPLGNRCDMLHVSHGHIRPVAPLPEDVEGERWRPGCYAEIGGADD